MHSRDLSTSRLAFVVLIHAASVATAQTVTVQQPIVDVFNVDTVVSVPDRGSILLGGVGRASEAGFHSGFRPYGSSVGLERSNSSAWASVYIHDFEALDAELLATPTQTAATQSVAVNPLAANAYRSLSRQHAAAVASTVSPSTGVTAAATKVDRVLPPAANVPAAGSAGSSRGTVVRYGRSVPAPTRLTTERFGRAAAPSDVQSSASTSSPAASSRATNSADSPAASRASR